MSRGGDAATLAVMTGAHERRLLWFRWQALEWKSMDRASGWRTFAERFLASPYRMVVLSPDFAHFDPQYHQSYVYMPLVDLTPDKTDADEREFVRRCIDRIRPERSEKGHALLVDGSFVGDLKGSVGIRWNAAFDAVERSTRLVSKQACLERILPALRDGIGDVEGGVYTPYGGDGIFHLLSI